MSVFDLNTSKGYEMADFENLSSEYTKHFIDYYNKESFNAFTAITTYRDESIRRINELKQEIDYYINDAEKEIKCLRVPNEQQYFAGDLFFELKPYLENLKESPNNRLREIFRDILEFKDYHKLEGLHFNKKINKTILDNVEEILDQLYFKSYELKRATIIKSAAAMIINNIIDLGAPYRFEGKIARARIRDLLPDKNVNKVNKDTIYEWYSEIKKVSKNKQEAFDKLKTEIVAQGLSVVDYIKTDDAENFDKAYREWLNRRLRK